MLEVRTPPGVGRSEGCTFGGMNDARASSGTPDQIQRGSFDAIVIGAGVSGMYQLIKLRELGLSVLVVEAGTGVGGTWYWNRYPGARFDSESYTYGYSFDLALQQDWDWSEHFSPQPETLRYLNHVADRYDLRDDIRFDSRVASVHRDDDAGRWRIVTEDGGEFDSRYVITAIGALSAPTMPAIDGVDEFEGQAFHTGTWPHEPVDFAGKRVGVIGTGATAVQLIQEVAKTAAQLTVFQRTANWCAPLHNSEITPEQQADIKSRYAEIIAGCNDTFAGFMHDSDRRKALEVSEEERLDFYEKLYAEPGFGIWMANFRDVLVDERANATLSEFVADKIRERVDDPELAELLIPKNHGFGTRRVPMETRYYEVYNQPNVRLVDITANQIQRVVPAGVELTDNGPTGSAEVVELDYLVYATGFDAVTGPFDRIDFRGSGGRSLRDVWSQGPLTYLGLAVQDFPNLFTLVGPHNASTFCNMPRCIEQNVEWVSDLIGHMEREGHESAHVDPDAAAAWTEHVYQTADRMLLSKVNSWFMGINSNVEGKQERRFLLYAGGLPYYRERCEEIAANGYEGFRFDSRETVSP